jgi:hypothetical protein
MAAISVILMLDYYLASKGVGTVRYEQEELILDFTSTSDEITMGAESAVQC